ncbi:MAG: hypothetical protein MEQ84_06685 [Mesorhizobium sp.]|nr:hypothetical protein [Mesorhizobium sp.]
MTSKGGMTDAMSGRSAGRFVGIVALFAMAGPPIGGLVVSVFLSLLAATPQLMVHDWVEAVTIFLTGTLFGTMFGLPIAYFSGVLPAAGVGLAVAICDRRMGLISWRIAMAAAIVSWVFVAMGAGSLIESDEGTRTWQIASLLAHLAAASFCWWMARTIFGRPMHANAVGT